MASRVLPSIWGYSGVGDTQFPSCFDSTKEVPPEGALDVSFGGLLSYLCPGKRTRPRHMHCYPIEHQLNPHSSGGFAPIEDLGYNQSNGVISNWIDCRTCPGLG